MIVQYTSDLHLESSYDSIRPSDISGDILILAGDIDESGPKNFSKAVDFFSRIGNSKAGIPVVAVMGNHDYFSQDISDPGITKTEFEATGNKNIHLLEMDTFFLSGVRFVGATLWTDFAKGTHGTACERAMPEYANVYSDQMELTWKAVAARHKKTVEWLRQTLSTPFSGPTVVVTHHAPSWKSNPPVFARSPLSGGFCSDLEPLILEFSPALWIHGHVHESMNYKIGNTLVLANPRGYELGDRFITSPENHKWKRRAVVEIDPRTKKTFTNHI